MRLINDVSATEQTNKQAIVVFTVEGKLFLATPKPDCLLSSAKSLCHCAHFSVTGLPTVCTSDTEHSSAQYLVALHVNLHQILAISTVFGYHVAF
jgi:hypothetical protein